MADWSLIGCPKSCLTNCTFKSEYGHGFQKTPYASYKECFEVPVPCSRFVFPQELYERSNQLLPHYSKHSSTYRDNYKPCESIKPRTQISSIIQSRPDHQLVDIDAKNCGYEKYLDIYATTKALDHRTFSPREVKHDPITVWDWLEIPKARGSTIPLKVPIQERDVANTSKIKQPKRSNVVPNSGFLSEYQHEFKHQSLERPNFV